jgi:hypothetical protein
MSNGANEPGDPRTWQSPPGPYGGVHQPGWQDPNAYGQPGPGPEAYGQPGYWPNQYGQGQYPPYGYPPRQDGTRTHAIVALVISLILALSCYVTPGGITGAILSGIALSKVDQEPGKSKTLLKWTWIAIGANIALLVAGVVTLIVLGTNGYLD